MKPAGKIERALGMNLGLKPHRCNSPKCPYIRRQSRPGVHGKGRAGRRGLSEYGKELLEKQRVRFSYGLDERALRRAVALAKKSGSERGVGLLLLLSRRLDAVLYQAGLAASLREARVLVRHGHFNLNGKPVRSPSLLVKGGDVITVREQSLDLFRARLESAALREAPAWMSFNPETLSVEIMRLPAAEELAAMPFDTRLVIEYYSR